MENFDEKTCLCALNRIFGFEPKIGLAIIEYLGSAKAAFEIGSQEMDELTGPYFKYKGRICQQAYRQATTELERLAREGIQFCGWSEDCYPEALRECEDPPIGLYVKSSTPLKELWATRSRIAVVGTRDISQYGKEWCRRIVGTLAHSDKRPTIVSGLALGTDITAHQCAIESGLPTIAVMATGPDSIYPHRHRHFAEMLALTPGCALISDYPPGTAPLAIHFIRRNRIIAGLSDATILIESKIKGGGMTTCRLAHSYNRDVFALPGRVDDIRSQGCNELIYKKIAEPITSEECILKCLGMKAMPQGSTNTMESHLHEVYGSRLPEDRLACMSKTLWLIKKNRGISLEELARLCQSDYRTLLEITGLLELDGFISIDLMQRCSINYKNV